MWTFYANFELFFDDFVIFCIFVIDIVAFYLFEVSHCCNLLKMNDIFVF